MVTTTTTPPYGASKPMIPANSNYRFSILSINAKIPASLPVVLDGFSSALMLANSYLRVVNSLLCKFSSRGRIFFSDMIWLQI